MYTIENNFKYKLVDLYCGKEITFKDKETLIKYSAKHEKYNWLASIDTCFKDRESHTINTILDNIGCNDNDINADGTPKRYRLYAGDGRVICADMYRQDVIKVYKESIGAKRKWNNTPWWADKIKVKFRCDPIPYTGFKYRGHYYRRPKTMNEKRKAADVEYKQYIKPKRNVSNLPDLWRDEKVRHIDKCWKSQSKKKRQWM